MNRDRWREDLRHLPLAERARIVREKVGDKAFPNVWMTLLAEFIEEGPEWQSVEDWQAAMQAAALLALEPARLMAAAELGMREACRKAFFVE